MVASLSQPKAYFISLFCEAIFVGIYTFLFCAALYLLRRRREKNGRTNLIMLFATIVMYCLSIVHVAFSYQINLVALFDQKVAQADSATPKSVETTENIYACTPIVAETLNCIIGDCIVIWRTWVLWNRNWKIIYFPCALLLGAIVASAFLVRSVLIALAGPTIFNEATIASMIASCILMMGVNVYAIIAIGYRVWSHSRTMKVFSGTETSVSGGLGGKYLGVLFIFVESGFIYSIIPIAEMVLFGTTNISVSIVIGVLAQLTGIYPTAIIVLVCLQLTQHDHITRVETAMKFAERRHDDSSEHLGQESTTTTNSAFYAAASTHNLSVSSEDKPESSTASESMV
ncbi:hypothetical protein GYMLUDRAFT_248375 [Collybiopsis luxurians FD-317 M1]|uniref:Uncharacterized protein n=1 Tax=Collybiopsis luxurians FD-317 M1 TaxID=944289 RepID=A0A0D0C0C9_9AGAR|nr:hypothetical protein GYMLUDRAFT_248375 [Collybiopsis luxurians FD-317 M1]